ncbi:hypothetical protein AJ80_07416 [Polytolypa hystricis UAMH7299]|uniref:FAD-binding FR-type domain-containing protein n=1 Tax=Polytolypa hystricis (strain UAMH7299) TaxID=1447883 RepID=A0A2B7XNM7_POLH7|nr:hypothetical protein AJ80_07416 [Polytolypa hystricis UAMH7299]
MTFTKPLPRLVIIQPFSSIPKRARVPDAPVIRHIYSRRNASSTSTTTSTPPSPPPKRRPWLRIAIVTVFAAGIGAYTRSNQDALDTILNPDTFTRYELVSKTPVSSTCSIFTMRPLHPTPESLNEEVYYDAWQRGVWSVQFKQPQLQIGRDYTPLPPTANSTSTTYLSTDPEEREALRFLIRKETGGEVSGYLHSLEPGSTIDMRGPHMGFEFPSDVQDVLFIAGGTGIAPALQAAHTLFQNSRSSRMHILWANRRREDCIGGVNDISSLRAIDSRSRKPWWRRIFSAAAGAPVDEPPTIDDPLSEPSLTVKYLDDIKAHYPRLTVDYFVDEEGSLITPQSILGFTKTTNTQQPPPKGNARVASKASKKLILISGPDGFISFLAGPKTWQNGNEVQGPLRGLLSQLDLKDWTVWKL